MGFRTISLSDDAYEKLASLKREGESFRDVILKLCSGAAKKPLASFAGVWTMGDDEVKEIFGEISGLWKRHEEGLFGHRLSRDVNEKTS